MYFSLIQGFLWNISASWSFPGFMFLDHEELTELHHLICFSWVPCCAFLWGGSRKGHPRNTRLHPWKPAGRSFPAQTHIANTLTEWDQTKCEYSLLLTENVSRPLLFIVNDLLFIKNNTGEFLIEEGMEEKGQDWMAKQTGGQAPHQSIVSRGSSVQHVGGGTPRLILSPRQHFQGSSLWADWGMDVCSPGAAWWGVLPCIAMSTSPWQLKTQQSRTPQFDEQQLRDGRECRTPLCSQQHKDFFLGLTAC